MIVLTQRAWSGRDPAALREPLRAAVKLLQGRADLASSPAPALILLPVASLDLDAPPDQAALTTALGALASAVGAFLAGAARARAPEPSGAIQMHGFLFGPDGARLLWVPKITPSLATGFDDCASALGQPAEFPVARTPLGQIGLLVGEDVHYATYARALAFQGAELILNPSEACLDDDVEIRAASRLGRAGENTACVATASALVRSAGGVTMQMPAATSFNTWTGKVVAAHGAEDFVYPDFDVQALRRARLNPHRSMPALVRANLYAHGYAKGSGSNGSKRDVAAAPKAGAATSPSSIDGWRAEAHRRHERLYRVAAKPAAAAPEELQYEALLVQHCARLIPLDRSVDAPSLIERNLSEALELAGSRANVPSVRLVVFPEFWLTGPGGIGGVHRTVEDMERLALRHPGPVFDRIGEFAQ